MAPQNRRIVTLRDIASNVNVNVNVALEGENTGSSRDSGAAVLPQNPAKLAPSVSSSNPLAAPFCQPASSAKPIPLLAHISSNPDHLPMAEICRQTLERIWKEFAPIIRRRGYNVKSISELCCCGDGLDTTRSRKLRKQSDNVWGYNQTTFFGRRGGSSKTTSHNIHLRLRQPKHHATQLLSWEDVAGTMAHELSHCVHQNHSKAFYQLMEELLEEHATTQVQSMGSIIYGGNSGAPASTATTATVVVPSLPNSGGQRLGGNNGGSNLTGKSRLLNDNTNTSKEGAGYRLNTNIGKNNSRQAPPLSPKARRDAMARAAETRRKQMEQLRRMIEASKEPCVIEILDDDDEEDNNQDENKKDGSLGSSGRRIHRQLPLDSKPRAATRSSKPVAGNEGRLKKVRSLNVGDNEDGDDSIIIDITDAATPRASKRSKSSAALQQATIDLTSPPPIMDRHVVDAAVVAAPVVPDGDAMHSRSTSSDNSEWQCSRCTFFNKRPLALVCAMCHEERKIPVQGDKTEGPIEID
jgi:hypothetical protein